MGVMKDLSITFEELLIWFQSEEFNKDVFMENYDYIRELYQYSDIIMSMNGQLREEYFDEKIKTILHDIYISNMEINDWADEIPEDLLLFLRLKGEDV